MHSHVHLHLDTVLASTGQGHCRDDSDSYVDVCCAAFPLMSAMAAPAPAPVEAVALPPVAATAPSESLVGPVGAPVLAAAPSFPPAATPGLTEAPSFVPAAAPDVSAVALPVSSYSLAPESAPAPTAVLASEDPEVSVPVSTRHFGSRPQYPRGLAGVRALQTFMPPSAVFRSSLLCFAVFCGAPYLDSACPCLGHSDDCMKCILLSIKPAFGYMLQCSLMHA